MSNINEYMINEITTYNPLDMSFEAKAKSKEEYILEKLFNGEKEKIITKSNLFEFYHMNSAIEAMKIKIHEAKNYILKKYELNLTKNHIYKRSNTITLSIKENESLIESLNDRIYIYLMYRYKR